MLALSACGGRVGPDDGMGTENPGASDGAAGATGTPGSLLAEVDLPAGISATAVSYTVSGPAGLHRTSMLNFPASQVLEVSIPDLPPSQGDTLSLSLTADDGATCTGMCSFAIVAGAQSTAKLFPSCTGGLPPGVGSAASSTPAMIVPVQPSPPPTSPPEPSHLGTIVVTIDLPSGVSIATVDAVLSGPNGLDVHNSLTTGGGSFKFDYENVPPAMGDTITVKGTTTDGTEECNAQSMLDVIADQSTETTLFVRCQAAAVGGDP
jgi:hypothetical protein